MCGIVAIYKTDKRPVDLIEIKMMASTISHRGPDENGYALLNEGAVGLGQVRLSIIDLKTGQQPMYNEDGRICIIYNGEIYDYKKWQTELIRRGHKLRTSCDTEVIIHLYEEYGPSFVEKLNGEFAFIIWDNRQKQIIACRDRSGVKPLFYHQGANEILFASEAKAILTIPRVPAQISNEYLTGTFMGSIPSDAHLFKNIRALPPGNILIANQAGIKIQKYWDFCPKPDMAMSREDACHTIRELLIDSVKRRMVADVVVGNYLSGGIDSTLICAIMSKNNQKMTSFNIGFDGSIYDESRIAEKVANHFQINFESVNCPMQVLAENFQKTLYHTELCIGNPSAIGKFILSDLVSHRNHKVCLTGEGSDEIFGGYTFFKLEQLWSLLRGHDQKGKELAQKLYPQLLVMEHRSRGLLWDDGVAWKRGTIPFGYPSFHQLRAENIRRYPKLFFNARALGFTDEHNPATQLMNIFKDKKLSSFHQFNAGRIIAFAQMSGYIIPTLGDRVEMAHSVECRTPYLDKDLIDFSLSIPPEYFIDLGRLQEKKLLRLAFSDYIPDFVRNDHKQPFFCQNWKSFSQSKTGNELINDFLSFSNLKKVGIFNPLTVQAIRALFNILPESMTLGKRIDIFIGMILGIQNLHHLFIENRPRGDKNFEMKERTFSN